MNRYARRAQLSRAIGFVSMFILGLSSAPLGAAGVQVRQPKVEEVRLKAEVGIIMRIVEAGGYTYLLDERSSRIHRVSAASAITIGGIGNLKGEFYRPMDMTVSTTGTLAVKDNGNHRIQILKADGTYVNEFPDLPRSMGLAVDRAGNVYLGQPENGSLVSVYDHDGKKIRSFGNLVLPSEIYGVAYKDRDDSRKIAMNRIRILLDDAENVWVIFRFLPLVCKFSPSGEMLLRKVLDFPEIATVREAVWKEGTCPPGFFQFNFDGVAITFVSTDAAIDQKNKELVLLLGDSRILALNFDGSPKYIIAAPKEPLFLQSLAASTDGILLVSSFIQSGIYRIGR